MMNQSLRSMAGFDQVNSCPFRLRPIMEGVEIAYEQQPPTKIFSPDI